MLRSTSEFNIRGSESIKMKVGNELKFRLHAFCDVDFFPPGSTAVLVAIYDPE
jgi:hypothetical protein